MSDQTITFYWRPGCGFCMMLDRSLRRLGIETHKRNIWDDEEAAAFVRSVARGNETVPTVVVADRAMVNPSVDHVLAAIHTHAPDLVPADPPPRPGLRERLFGS